ncbi:MAG TPA: hypothetical protein VLC28_07765 [Flavitalea sp.]|nr:hypothetical protein [Flavitalea sp.]
MAFVILLLAFTKRVDRNMQPGPQAVLIPSKKFVFNSFVDCNMAEVWVGDTLRIFPGKYGEDPLWGNARDLKYADGKNADEAFSRKSVEFTEPIMPVNAPVGQPGLHGAVWFETIYQDQRDASGKSLFAVYHNENYPATLPYDADSRTGYINKNWPTGITGPASPAAVCRIGLMRSTDGGHSWVNLGLFIEDLQPTMVLKPHRASATFGGGVGDPSAVRSGDYLYLFFSEYGYPGKYDSSSYSPALEHSGQCISVARIAVNDLDSPAGKAKRWSGKAFNVQYNQPGAPVLSLQIPTVNGGGPISDPGSKYFWGPSVSWNTYLKCWVMLMAKAEADSWVGNSVYISFNKNADLSKGDNSQQWSKPELLFHRPGHTIWYPSLQPLNSPDDIANKYTSVRLGQKARLFFKDITKDSSQYVSEFIVDFRKR